MLLRTDRRPGFSLTEGLIAIFVVALGLLGVLSLFPLAAMHMAQAMKDDRTGQANHNASTLIRQFWRAEIEKQPKPPNDPVYSLRYRDPFVDAMLNPNAPFPVPPVTEQPAGSGNWVAAMAQVPYQSPLPAISPYSSSPSYPVYLDPLGWANPTNISNGAQRYYVAGRTDGIPRRSLITLQTQAFQPLGFVAQLDDIGFGKDGTPAREDDPNYNTAGALGFNAMANQVQRDGRYTWAFMLRRPKAILWDQSDLTVVVYNGRSLDGPSPETSYDQAQFVQGSTEVLVPYTGARPSLRRGQWILDATMVNAAGQPDGHGFFYRVVNVNDDNAGLLILEIQSPARASTVANNGTGYGVAVVMENVSEVFERRTLTKVIVPVP